MFLLLAKPICNGLEKLSNPYFSILICFRVQCGIEHYILHIILEKKYNFFENKESITSNIAELEFEVDKVLVTLVSFLICMGISGG